MGGEVEDLRRGGLASEYSSWGVGVILYFYLQIGLYIIQFIKYEIMKR